MLKSYVWGGGVGWVAHKILESAQGPLVLVLGLWFGPGLENIKTWVNDTYNMFRIMSI